MHCKIKKVRDLAFESFIKMASRSVLLGSLTSKIKGDHAYRSNMKVVDRLFCTIEPDNMPSDNAIVVKSGNDDIVGHVPKTLAKKLVVLILGVKNKLRNAWAYFRGGAYFWGFTVSSLSKLMVTC